MLELGVKALLAYFLGSIVGSLLVGRLQGGVDIRSLGSGNAGGTNALRTRGATFAAWVVLIDVGKGLLAAVAIPYLDLPGIPIAPDLDRDWLTAACAAAAVVGHVYPVWYGFRGGKGAATLIGTILGTVPVLVIPALVVWLIVVALSGFVGLGTMLASLALPVSLLAFVQPPPRALFAFTFAMAAFVIYTHRSNILRMRAGTESRAQRLWLLRPR